MSDIDPKYYDQLFERVLKIIQTPRLDPEGQLLMHIYKSNTWGMPSAYTAFRPSDAPEHLVVNRVMWKSKLDIQRMNQVTQPAVPTLLYDQAPLNPDEFETLMDVGRKIRVPLFDVKMAGGFDGAYYGMVLPPPEQSPIQSELQLQWWEHGADTWQPFTGWVIKLIELFDAAF